MIKSILNFILLFFCFNYNYFNINKTKAIEVVFNKSSTQNGIALNGFEKIRIKTSSKLTQYHYATDYNTKIAKEEFEDNLTQQDKIRRELMLKKALYDFQNKEFISSHRKSNPEILTTSIGFGIGFDKLDFTNQHQDQEEQLSQYGNFLLQASGISGRINLTIRSVATFYYAPGIYNATLIRQDNNVTSKYSRFLVGHSAGLLVRLLPFSVSEGLILGLNTIYIHRVASVFFSIGIVIE